MVLIHMLVLLIWELMLALLLKHPALINYALNRIQAEHLSGGEQQMVSMGRGLMSAPKFLLIDEPSLGLAPVIVEQVFDIIEQLKKEKFSILLVEQNLHMALSVAHTGYVIENGTVVLAGSGQALLNNNQVREKYLGI